MERRTDAIAQDKEESETSLMRSKSKKSLEKMDRLERDDVPGKKSRDVRDGLRAIKFPTIPEDEDAEIEWDDFVPDQALYAFASSALHSDVKLDKPEGTVEAARTHDAAKKDAPQDAVVPLDEVVSKVAAKPPPLHLMQAHSGDAGAAAIAESLWVCVPQVVEWGGLPIDDMSDACFFLHLATGMYLCAGNDTHTDADKMVLRCSITLSSSLEEATLFKVSPRFDRDKVYWSSQYDVLAWCALQLVQADRHDEPDDDPDAKTCAAWIEWAAPCAAQRACLHSYTERLLWPIQRSGN